MKANSMVMENSIENLSSLPIGTDPEVLTNIYQPENNVAIWQRDLPRALTLDIQDMLHECGELALVKSVTPDNAAAILRDKLVQYRCADALSEDVALIVDMFCCLFDLGEVGLRLTVLDKPMCPRFHVDHIPCRLVTTYLGEATEWLQNNDVNRHRLGAGSLGQPDHLSGLLNSISDIQQMSAGDVALLKGSGWEGNEHCLVHRSPKVLSGERRLMLTLDMM